MQNSTIYQLNHRVYSRWYYDWESGANKAQRLMRHVLKAYVVERIEDSQLMRVVGVVCSPEFTVISYRRANQATDRTELEQETADSSDTHLDSQKQGLNKEVSRSSSTTGDSVHHELKRRRRQVTATSVSLRDSTPAELFEDRVLWEHANSDMVTVSKNLSLVYWFLQWTPLDSYACFVDELVHMMNHTMLGQLTIPGYRVEKLNCFARVLLEHAQLSTYRQRSPVSRELEILLRAMAKAALWIFSADMRWWTGEFVRRHAATVTSKQQLREVFLQWLNDLEIHLNKHVFSLTPLQSLTNVAEEIIAAVYTHELYHPKRPVIRQILGEHGFLGWRPFVAQMREWYIAFSGTQSVRRNVVTATQSMWMSDWQLDLAESSWSPNATVVYEGVSLLSVLNIMNQLTNVHITFQINERSVHLQSHAPFAYAMDGGMKLILDGKNRFFRFLPNGWSAATSEGAMGDYIGTFQFESSDRLVMYIETFQWSRMSGTRSYHTRLRVECWQNHKLIVTGDVLETQLADTFSEQELQYLSELKIGAKLQAVNKLHTRSAAAMMSLAPGPITWRPYGTLQMSYLRVQN